MKTDKRDRGRQEERQTKGQRYKGRQTNEAETNRQAERQSPWFCNAAIP